MSDTLVGEMIKADALGFIAPQGRAPIADDNLSHNVHYLHTTAAPPFFEATEAVLRGADTPNAARHIMGVEDFRRTIEAQDELHLVRTAQDMKLAMELGKTGILLGLQHTPYDADRTQVKQLFESGIRIMGIEYKKGQQRFGSGWMDSESGLTADGRQLLEDMAATGLILDLSHAGNQTALDALDFIEASELPLPVMASHGGVYEDFDGDKQHINNRRNLRQATLEKIWQRGGLIGIYSLTFGLSGSDNSTTSFYDHIHAAEERFPGAVAIGSDAVYQKRDMLEWQDTHKMLVSTIAQGTDMEPRFPDTPLELNTPKRLLHIGDRLLADGMSVELVEQVVGKTLADFLVKNLPAAD